MVTRVIAAPLALRQEPGRCQAGPEDRHRFCPAFLWREGDACDTHTPGPAGSQLAFRAASEGAPSGRAAIKTLGARSQMQDGVWHESVYVVKDT